ncbi:MAG TPA: hypothetical protein VF148_10545 [Acidimicrobiia bacterium]
MSSTVESGEGAQAEVSMAAKLSNRDRPREHSLDEGVGGGDLEQRLTLEIEGFCQRGVDDV